MVRWSPGAAWSRVPWWGTVAVGLVAVALGAVLIAHPLASLSVVTAVVAAGLAATGIATLSGPPARGGATWPRLVGGAWLVAALAVLVWPDLSTDALADVVGIALVVGGLWDLALGLPAAAGQRTVAVAGGLTTLLFGVLALAWPDVTVLVVSVVFGFRLVLLGLRVGWSAIRSRHGGVRHRDDRRPVGRARRAGRVAGSFAALAVALGATGLSVHVHRSQGVLDAFYDTPDDLPDQPGVLLRSEPFDRAVPEGARAWRILYTTTSLDGVPAAASGLVVAPDEASGEPTPAIAWAHGTTGVARRCAPSVLPDPWGAGALFVLDRVIQQGWALVAPDYPGLGAEGAHPYLVGEPAGRSVLDAVRAARQVDGLALGGQTVVWGHSQGGGAALWTGILAPTYAPDVDVVGVAALAPASDLLGLMDTLGRVTGGSIFASYAVRGYADAYDDIRVDQYVRSVGRTTFDRAAARCLDAAALASLLSSITVGMDIFRDDLTSGPLVGRLAENIPSGAIEAPLLVAQGEADGLVLPEVQDRYVAARCAAGHPVDHRSYPGLGHVPLVQADSPLIPELLAWTEARLRGAPPTPTC